MLFYKTLPNIKMNQAILRSTLARFPAIFSHLQSPRGYYNTSGAGFRQLITTTSHQSMEHGHDETEDVLHSLGKEYATRAEEEGFGVIYEKNQTVAKARIDDDINEKHFAYEETRISSEVKEEKAPRQPKA